MAAEFVTAPSTPEPDTLEIVVERRLRQEDGGEGEGGMTIFRVPAHVRDANRELYEPRLVSIGPYYRGREALRAMEQHKWRLLRELVALRPGASLADFVGAVRDVEQQARRCYSERTDIFDADADAAAAQLGEPSGGVREDVQSRRGDPGPGSDDFAEMLLLDGCFILQFFIKWHNTEPDELCDVGWGLAMLHSDLLLLENQIPFFVLEELFRVAAPDAESVHLRRLILPHLRLDADSTFFRELSADEVPQSREIHHLLHLFYEAFVPSPPLIQDSPPRLPQYVSLDMLRRMKLSSLTILLHKASAWFSKFTPATLKEPEPAPLAVPSATLLREAGVRFEKEASPRHMFDIAFDTAKGAVRMPRVEVDHASKPLLVNLVAFEQSRGRRRGTALPLSSYAALMGALVRTGRDVGLLQRRGIIDNLLAGDDDAATSFFQKLGECSTLEYDQHLFAAMFADLNRYYQSSWRRHKARFLRDNCSSPWSVVALAVAVFAFCFALVKFSTVIYSLVRPGHCHC